jgi:hypothetical protein
MDSTAPADLLKLKACLEAWRATRKYSRQPIPDEFCLAAARESAKPQTRGYEPGDYDRSRNEEEHERATHVKCCFI